MKLSARECNKNIFRLRTIIALLLISIVFTGCVSQEPKSTLQNANVPESSNTEAAAPQATTPNEAGNQTANNEKQQDASIAPVMNNQESPEFSAFYRSSPRQKELVVVLLNPPMPEPAKAVTATGNPAQTGQLQQAQSSPMMQPQQANQPAQNPQGQNPQGQNQPGQTQSTQTAPSTQSAQNQSTQNAQVQTPAQNSQTGTASGSQKPGQTNANPGSAGKTGTATAGSSSPATNSAGSTAQPSATTVQPVIPFAPASSSAAITAAPSSTPVPARELVVEKNKPFTVTLDGNGWIYLGDEYNRQGIRYESRQLIDNQIVYRLNGDRTGDFLLRFQRDNPVTQLPETQYIKVTITDGNKPDSNTGTQGTQTAPVATQGMQTSQAATQTTQTAPPTSQMVAAGTASTTGNSAIAPSGTSSAGMPVAGAAPSVSSTQGTAAGLVPGTAQSAVSSIPAPLVGSTTGTSTVPLTRDMIASMTDAASVLEIARTQLAQKQIALVLGALDRYLVLNPGGSDEVLYLYALAYEQDTPYRDIQKAYSYYKQLVREYPLSTYRQYALERITYLERFYPGLR
ncbi:MAG TPA: outer membrane protein assembly factor BamD [Spirochaetia bacterium]|nr:outer membrane protein assembly factor BamD [Spirochaetales bacterium]HPD80119.1 outer membrane protein assembly factor BamD [Spirochaetales bacterium]HRS64915.1 outer membrane protein assembly factor BamD [Spirochaetia bacterium]HRV27522.1 outer membrane protein assembly factor BamD [Spirochaetia bacterium]